MSEGPCVHDAERPYVLLNHWSGGTDRWPICTSCARDFEIAIRRFAPKLHFELITSHSGVSNG